VTRSAARARKKPAERNPPVLQRFQVEVRGGRYFVIDTERKVVVAGPFVHRMRAQAEADRLERNAPMRSNA
jgi:hypothetical protein